MANPWGVLYGVAGTKIKKGDQVKYPMVLPMGGQSCMVYEANGEEITIPYREFVYATAIEDAEPGEGVLVQRPR